MAFSDKPGWKMPTPKASSGELDEHYEVAMYMSNYPKALQSTLSMIKVVPGNKFGRKNWRAAFGKKQSEDTGTLYLNKDFIEKEGLEPAIDHEIGHSAYYAMQKSKKPDIDEYTSLFSKAKNFISDYARGDAKEDFAEMFKHLMNDTTRTEAIATTDENFKQRLETVKNAYRKYWGDVPKPRKIIGQSNSKKQ